MRSTTFWTVEGALLTVRNIAAQWGQNVITVRESERYGFSVIVTSSEAYLFFVFSVSQAFVYCFTDEKKMLVESSKIEEIDIFEFLIFVGHRSVRKIGTGRRCRHSVHYLCYLRLESYNPYRSLALSYGVSISRCKVTAQRSFSWKVEKETNANEEERPGKRKKRLASHLIHDTWYDCVKNGFKSLTYTYQLLVNARNDSCELNFVKCFVVDSTGFEQKSTIFSTKAWSSKWHFKLEVLTNFSLEFASFDLLSTFRSVAYIIFWRKNRELLQMVQMVLPCASKLVSLVRICHVSFALVAML